VQTIGRVDSVDKVTKKIFMCRNGHMTKTMKIHKVTVSHENADYV